MKVCFYVVPKSPAILKSETTWYLHSQITTARPQREIYSLKSWDTGVEERAPTSEVLKLEAGQKFR